MPLKVYIDTSGRGAPSTNQSMVRAAMGRLLRSRVHIVLSLNSDSSFEKLLGRFLLGGCFLDVTREKLYMTAKKKRRRRLTLGE